MSRIPTSRIPALISGHTLECTSLYFLISSGSSFNVNVWQYLFINFPPKRPDKFNTNRRFYKSWLSIPEIAYHTNLAFPCATAQVKPNEFGCQFILSNSSFSLNYRRIRRMPLYILEIWIIV